MEFEIRFARDREGRISAIACRFGDGAAKSVAAAVEAVQHIERFLANALTVGAAIEGRNAAAKLFEAYQAWANREGFPAMSMKGFGETMRAAGFERVTSDGRKWIIPPGTAAKVARANRSAAKLAGDGDRKKRVTDKLASPRSPAAGGARKRSKMEKANPAGTGMGGLFDSVENGGNPKVKGRKRG